MKIYPLGSGMEGENANEDKRKEGCSEWAEALKLRDRSNDVVERRSLASMLGHNEWRRGKKKKEAGRWSPSSRVRSGRQRSSRRGRHFMRRLLLLMSSSASVLGVVQGSRTGHQQWQWSSFDCVVVLRFSAFVWRCCRHL